MTKKSKADLTSQVNSLLPDNIVGNISPLDVRANLTDGIDSFAAIDTGATPADGGIVFWTSSDVVSYDADVKWDSSDNELTLNGQLIMQNDNAPASSSATCTQGEIRWGSSSGNHYLYICVSTDTWKRAELASF